MNPTLCRTLFAAASLALTGCGGKLIYGEMEEPTLVLTQPLGQTVPPGPPFPVTAPQGLLTFTFSVPDIPLSGGSTTSTQAGVTPGRHMQPHPTAFNTRPSSRAHLHRLHTLTLPLTPPPHPQK